MSTTQATTQISDVSISMPIAAKIFYDVDLVQALATMQEQQYRALFMPGFADARIASNQDSPLWEDWYLTQSLKATGTTKTGTPVVVYVHIPHYFSDPKHLAAAKEQGLHNGAAPFPKKELEKLLRLEDGQNVVVLDHATLKNAKYGLITVEEALNHPQTIPFFSTKERAETYLDKHQHIIGPKIQMGYVNDLAEQPLGRLLFAGPRSHSCRLSDDDLSTDVRFVGVPFVPPQAAATKNSLVSKGS